MLLQTPSFPKGSTVRFDGFLVNTAGVASLMAEATSQVSPEGGWGVESDQALVVMVRGALSDAAMSALDQMEEEVVIAATKGELTVS